MLWWRTYYINKSIGCFLYFLKAKNPLIAKLDFYMSPTHCLKAEGEKRTHLETQSHFSPS